MSEELEAKAALPRKIAPGYVVIDNPMFGVNADEIDKELEKLPPAAKKEYLQKTMQKHWEKLQVVAVSNIGISWIEPGDVVMGTPDILDNVILLPTKEHMAVKESLIKAIY